MGMTASSGPGIALKSEALGLAVMVELPLVLVDVQRSGPSTGMPTKTEQADLLQVMYGRNSDSPVAVVAPATPGECFQFSIEAWRLALKYMTPVVYMSDAFLATGAEPWRIPSVDDLPSIAVPNRTEREGFYPYLRDETTLARPWAVPGTPGLEHRIGGLEKADILGNVSYDPENHHRMQLLRQAKIAAIAADIPPLEVYGPAGGRPARPRLGLDVRRDPERGRATPGRAAHRSPTPTCATSTRSRRTPATSSGAYKRVLIPEVNLGQLSLLIRAKYLIDAIGYNRVRGKPFRIAELEAEARAHPRGGGRGQTVR